MVLVQLYLLQNKNPGEKDAGCGENTVLSVHYFMCHGGGGNDAWQRSRIGFAIDIEFNTVPVVFRYGRSGTVSCGIFCAGLRLPSF
jgi:hypothetical protein